MGSNTDTAIVAPDPGVTDEAPLVIRPDLRAELERMLDAVPESDGEAWDRIITQIVTAGTPDELDTPWRAEGLKVYRNRRVLIRSIRRVPSSFEGGLGFFLVVEGADADSGETFTATTSSLAVVVQLLKAYDAGMLPLLCIPRLADKATERGFLPMHLEVVRR